MKIKNITLLRNIPFKDTNGLGFHFQRAGKTFWIEVPFMALSFRIK